MDPNDDAGPLLDQLDVLRHPSDLDLLIFFARHPRALLASEHLARFLGYGAKEIAASVDLLLEAGFLTRTPNPKHAARMYVFAPVAPGGDWLLAVLQRASTRNGRLALMSALRRRSSEARGDSAQDDTGEKNGAPPPLPFPKGHTSPVDADGRRTSRRRKTSSAPRTHGGYGGER